MNEVALSRPLRNRLRLPLWAGVLLILLGWQAQIVHGTVASLQAQGDYIAVAADSLTVGSSRTTCKIAVLGDQIVFAASGIAGNKGDKDTSWNVFDLARQEYSAPRISDERVIRKVAEDYGRRIADKLNQELKSDHGHDLLTYLLSGNGIAGQAIFAGFDQKHQRDLVEVDVGIRSREKPVIETSIRILAEDGTPANDVIGAFRISEEYKLQQSERSRVWRHRLKVRSRKLQLKDRLALEAETIVALTTRYNPEYAQPPIDIVLISRGGGATWIHRKNECRLH